LNFFFKQIVKYDFRFIIILAERKNRYDFIEKTNKNALYIPNQTNLNNFSLLTVPFSVKRLVYKKFYTLLGEENQKIENIIDAAIEEKDLSFVNVTYKILYELSKIKHINYKFDWLEYGDIAKDNFPSLKKSYKYIAFFYYFRIRIPFSFFEKLYQDEKKDLKKFIDYYLYPNKEPIIFNKLNLSAFDSIYFMRVKHEIVAELFFNTNNFDNKKFTQILIKIIEVFDETDNYQVNCLLQLFGNKQIILDYKREYKINFSFVDDILNNNNLKNKFKTNFCLYGSIYMARFWELLKKNKKKAIDFLEQAVKDIPNDLHFKTELAKIYQTQKRYDKAEKVLLELLKINKFSFYAIAGLIRIYSDSSKPRKALKKVDEFLALKGLEFSDGSNGKMHQALFNNLFYLCKRYKYYDKGKEYFKEYRSILDSRNINSYNYNIEKNSFIFKNRDIVGLAKEIDNYYITIDNQKYKNYRFDVQVGDKVIFDLDFSDNIRNMEKTN
jgi:hypothetical protein